MDRTAEIISENIRVCGERISSERLASEYWLREAVRYLSRDELTALAETLEVRENVFIARELSKRKNGIRFHPDISGKAARVDPERISMMKNKLSEVAYGCFFGREASRVTERSAFAEIFEDVYNGESSACIVPIENTDSGRLTNFYSLISDYNFKISEICDVEQSEQDRVTRFALVVPPPIEISGREIEISIASRNAFEIERILSAAAMLDISPRRIDSIPFSQIAGEYSFYLSLVAKNESEIEQFLIFLDLCKISYTPIGIF